VENPFSNLSDKELMLKYQDGDHMAFEVLYSRHQGKIYSYLNKRLHEKEHCDDIFQRVLMKLHKSKHIYSANYEVLPWIYTITKSELLDFFKKKKINFIQFEETLHTDEVNEIDNEFDLSKESGLSSKEMEAIKLRYYGENDFKEISELLKTSEINVRKIISRGLKKLKQKYMKEGADDEQGL
jgi:RNA polymerase sigma-70 factor (ECF subfamily)